MLRKKYIFIILQKYYYYKELKEYFVQGYFDIRV